VRNENKNIATMSQNIYFITMINSNGDSWYHDRLEFLMTGKEMNLLKNAIKRNDVMDDEIMFFETKIANRITEKQLEKFEDVFDSWFAMGLILDTWDWIEKSTKEEEHMPNIEKINRELEVAKYNPRNPLGKLEVFRRAEEDGIEFKE